MFPRDRRGLPAGRSAAGALLSAVLVGTLAAGACSGESPGAGKSRDCVPVVGENGETSGRCLPVAAPGKRVDRGTPVFSDPLTID
ncbi:MAG: hypothetical protein ACRDTU_21700, partial [Micromonosporaceae bacterium]